MAEAESLPIRSSAVKAFSTGSAIAPNSLQGPSRFSLRPRSLDRLGIHDRLLAPPDTRVCRVTLSHRTCTAVQSSLRLRVSERSRDFT